ncbi:MAG TPA: hypothetical protein VFB58_02565 [Chloroflexota bacterium]|nr:hypothetical protein [Chloroflexota bacterium]
MKASAIKGLQVRPAGGEEVTGTVADLILDTDERRVVAVQVNRLENVEMYVLAAGDIEGISENGMTARRDAVLLPQEDAANYLTLPTFNRLLDQKAMTEGGDVLGKLADIDVNTDTWEIDGYGIVNNLAEDLAQGEHELSPDQVLSAGAHMLLVSPSGQA